jgi:AcrR family transcriptional regulator
MHHAIGATLSEPDRPRRRYDSPVRRQQAAETRERIVAAGAELLHGVPVWNWRALTVRAVAERAGVTERTVYRHFATERALRDAVMARLEQEAGVDLEDLNVERIQEVARRIFEHVSTFPIEPRTPPDPTVAAANVRQRDALMAAVDRATTRWPARDRTIAAALLDVLWSPVSFERLVTDWDLDPQQAIAGVTWAIGLVQRALSDGPRPLSRGGGPRAATGSDQE